MKIKTLYKVKVYVPYLKVPMHGLAEQTKCLITKIGLFANKNDAQACIEHLTSVCANGTFYEIEEELCYIGYNAERLEKSKDELFIRTDNMMKNYESNKAYAKHFHQLRE